MAENNINDEPNNDSQEREELLDFRRKIKQRRQELQNQEKYFVLSPFLIVGVRGLQP